MDIYEAPKSFRFPYLSCIYAFFLSIYFYVFWVVHFDVGVHIPAWVTAFPTPEILIAVLPVIMLFDFKGFVSAKRDQQTYINDIQIKVFELLENKKELQSKTHIYSNHADKLKLFISDKLLEFIEYDEKFLHFKSIASEVRHNGIISYDKINTYLVKQWQIAKSRSIAEVHELEEAVDSLRYLWDLLDLSTAENISLHIGNQVCSAEEMLFQNEMGSQSDSDRDFDAIAFNADSALLKAIHRSFGQPAQKNGEFGVWTMPDQQQVWINIDANDEILGNENHIVLALENIISNAHYYAGRVPGVRKKKDARIAIELFKQGTGVCYRIYNHGPHIPEEAADNILKLGFSTRRARAQNGRGLGLYFVDEISRGYDGGLSFKNVENREDVLSMRIELMNGEVITEVIELVIDDELPYLRKNGSEQSSADLTWDFQSEVESIEITHRSDQKTHRFMNSLLLNGAKEDPSQRNCPRWVLNYTELGAANFQLSLKTRDVSGVQFELRLPNLNARLNGDLLETDQGAMDDQLDALNTRFRALEN